MIEEEKARRDRLELLRRVQGDVYPPTVSPTHTVENFLNHFDVLQSHSEVVTLVGRARTIRKHGGLRLFIWMTAQAGHNSYSIVMWLAKNRMFNFMIRSIWEIFEVTGNIHYKKENVHWMLCLFASLQKRYFHCLKNGMV